MREDTLSRDSFFGDDQRDIKEIIADDAAVLAEAGIDATKIADTMRVLTQAGLGCRGEERSVGAYTVRVKEYMGFIGCPFKDGHQLTKRNTTICNEDGKTMTWTDANIHLIETHGFFEGRGAEYRLEPMELIDFLELKSE